MALGPLKLAWPPTNALNFFGVHHRPQPYDRVFAIAPEPGNDGVVLIDGHRPLCRMVFGHPIHRNRDLVCEALVGECRSFPDRPANSCPRVMQDSCDRFPQQQFRRTIRFSEGISNLGTGDTDIYLARVILN